MISYDLSSEHDIKHCITTAAQATGALKIFWDCESVDIYAKTLIYKAIVRNLLLWGCESWVLDEENIRQIRVSQMRSIQRIMKISIKNVKDERLANIEIYRRFFGIEDILDSYRYRKLSFIDKVVRKDKDKPSCQVLAAWLPTNRPPGRPRCTSRHTFTRAIAHTSFVRNTAATYTK